MNETSDICKSCAVCHSVRCPYFASEEYLDFPTYGCYRYVKTLVPFNSKGEPTSCGRCRYLFRKPRVDANDKTYVMCGCVSSLVQKIKPVPNCPNFKPIRRKQAQKRRGRKKGYFKGKGR